MGICGKNLIDFPFLVQNLNFSRYDISNFFYLSRDAKGWDCDLWKILILLSHAMSSAEPKLLNKFHCIIKFIHRTNSNSRSGLNDVKRIVGLKCKINILCPQLTECKECLFYLFVLFIFIVFN